MPDTAMSSEQHKIKLILRCSFIELCCFLLDGYCLQIYHKSDRCPKNSGVFPVSYAQNSLFHVAIELLNVSFEIGKRPPVSGIESICFIYKTN